MRRINAIRGIPDGVYLCNCVPPRRRLKSIVARSAKPANKTPALVRFDFEAFRQQAITFATLNLFLFAALLLLHLLFSSLLGTPTPTLLITLGGAFLLKMLELLWLSASARTLSETVADLLVWASIVLNIVLAFVLTLLTNRGESPYFVLLALPILQSAYRFRLPTCVSVIVACNLISFFWVWHFMRFHPPVKPGEYLEAGMISVVYALMGVLVWLLVNQLRTDQSRLSRSLDELERTREKLVFEEKLAMAGRLSSAVAHEIRNPVSIISSSLVTAARPELADPERKEMYDIARSEAARLEKLTADFLSYARPSQPRRAPAALHEVLAYVAEIARVQAANRGVSISLELENGFHANIDRDQLQRAILNLLLNAIDATPENGRITLRGRVADDHSVDIEIENSGDPIPKETLSRIFEPFFTTKRHGTGLGLAIAKNIAKAQGGDLLVTRNEPGHICFTLSVTDEVGAHHG